MAQTLGSVAVGSIGKINEGGSPVEFYVAKHDYESGLNGAGRTLLVRKGCYAVYPFDTEENQNTYADSTLDNWLNSAYNTVLNRDIQLGLSKTKFLYTPGNKSTETETLQRSVFMLSATEFGETGDGVAQEGSALPIAASLKKGQLDGSPVSQWTRSPDTNTTGLVWALGEEGFLKSEDTDRSYGIAPAFTLPAAFYVDAGGNVIRPLDAPKITVPSIAMQEQRIMVSWTAVDGADNYILERRADTDADWTQVYSGANTSFEEAVGTWTHVQYRIKAGVEGAYGDYAFSASVPVVSASAVVISGSDGDLGTLTDDVTYTVSSNGDKALTVVETINGTETRTFTAVNGGNNKIPVVDLPTGTGTIKITASTNPGSGVVSVTRNWTYTKTAITFPDAGSVADLTQQGKTIWPKTIAEAVRAPGIWGGSLGLALSKLAHSVQYFPDPIAKYAEVKVNLASKNEGDIISLPENGKMVEFYVAKLNYEQGLNGAGRTLLVRKDQLYDLFAWNSTNINTYASSSIDIWLNGTYKTQLHSGVQAAMGTTQFYYTPGGGNNTVSSLARSVFLLSVTEFGISTSGANVEGSSLPIASTLINVPRDCATRTPFTDGSDRVWYIRAGFQNAGIYNANWTFDCLPAFTLPATFTATYYVGSDGTVHDKQEYEEAGTFTDISGGAIPMVHIENGSYVGTGTYGASNKNIVKVNFPPKFAIISPLTASTCGSGSPDHRNNILFFVKGMSRFYTDGDTYAVIPSFGADFVSWYSSDEEEQYNETGTTYLYLIFG